jgi:hypothetical protein
MLVKLLEMKTLSQIHKDYMTKKQNKMAGKYKRMVTAFRIGIDPIPDWFMDKVTTNEITIHRGYNSRSDNFPHYHNEIYCKIYDSEKQESWQEGEYRHYIILDKAKIIYPMEPIRFEKMYEPVLDE